MTIYAVRQIIAEPDAGVMEPLQDAKVDLGPEAPADLDVVVHAEVDDLEREATRQHLGRIEELSESQFFMEPS